MRFSVTTVSAISYFATKASAILFAKKAQKNGDRVIYIRDNKTDKEGSGTRSGVY